MMEILNNQPGFYCRTIEEWHHSIYRIEDNYRIDFYPNSNSFHNINTKKRGIVNPNEFLSLFPEIIVLNNKE